MQTLPEDRTVNTCPPVLFYGTTQRHCKKLKYVHIPLMLRFQNFQEDMNKFGLGLCRQDLHHVTGGLFQKGKVSQH